MTALESPILNVHDKNVLGIGITKSPTGRMIVANRVIVDCGAYDGQIGDNFSDLS